jgi:uncharacterized protein
MHADGVVARYANAWLAGDIGTLIDLYDPDMVAHYGGASEFAGTHVGRDAFLGVLATSSGRSSRRLISVDLVLESGGTGAIFATEAIAVDGVEHQVQRALRYRTSSTHILEVWLYDMDQHLVDSAWRA